MLNKKIWFMSVLVAVVLCGAARADDGFIDDFDMVGDAALMDQVSIDAINAYDVDGSLFQQITDLEQEKVLMQLEKERAQLDLELDRLAAEKIKLHLEIDTLSGRAEAAQQELEAEKAKLEAEAARLKKEKESLAAATADASNVSAASVVTGPAAIDNIADVFRLINVIGAGAQLQATVEDLNTGQTKRLRAGTTIDGFAVKSISLDDGVVFVKDGETQTLNIGGGR